MGLPLKDIPNSKQTNDCQKHSYDQTACIAAKDDDGRPCGWCSGLNVLRYPYNPPTDSFCIHKHLIDWGACGYLKGELEPC